MRSGIAAPRVAAAGGRADGVDRLVAGHLAVALDHPLLARLSPASIVLAVVGRALRFGLATAAGIGRVRGIVTVTIGFTLYLLLSSTGAR